MRLPTFYEQNLIPNWGNIYICVLFIMYKEDEDIRYLFLG